MNARGAHSVFIIVFLFGSQTGALFLDATQLDIPNVAVQRLVLDNHRVRHVEKDQEIRANTWTMEELQVVDLPVHIPFTGHGHFVPQREPAHEVIV